MIKRSKSFYDLRRICFVVSYHSIPRIFEIFVLFVTGIITFSVPVVISSRAKEKGTNNFSFLLHIINKIKFSRVLQIAVNTVTFRIVKPKISDFFQVRL